MADLSELFAGEPYFEQVRAVHHLLFTATSLAVRTRLAAVLRRLRDERGMTGFHPSWNFEAIKTADDAERALANLADMLERDLAGTLEYRVIKTESHEVNGQRYCRSYFYHKDGTPCLDEQGRRVPCNLDGPVQFPAEVERIFASTTLN